MHQTCLVQWTWDILSIQDYPGASNECDPCSSHPSYENLLRWRRIPEEMTILRRVMAAWCLADITPLRMSQEVEERKEKWKRKACSQHPASNLGPQCQHSEFLNISSIFGATQHVIILSQSLEPGLPPISFMMLPRLWWIQHTYLAHLLGDDIHEGFSAYIPSLEHW